MKSIILFVVFRFLLSKLIQMEFDSTLMFLIMMTHFIKEFYSFLIHYVTELMNKKSIAFINSIHYVIYIATSYISYVPEPYKYFIDLLEPIE